MTDMDTIPAPATETPPPANDVVAKQLPRWALIGLFLYASVFTLSYAKDFLVPIVLAYLLAMVFGPIRRFFDRRGVPSALTSLVIVLVLLVGFLSLLGALAVPVSGWMERAPQIQHDIQSKLSSISQTFSGVFDAASRLSELTTSHSAGVQQVEVNDTSYIANAALFAPAAMAQFVFTLILLLFLLASGDMFYEKLVNVLPTFGDKKRAMRIAHDIERKLSRYLLTITLINAGFGVAVAVLLWAVGMPSPIVFGVLAFLLNYVPYLGALAGIVVSMSVALVSFDGLRWSVVVGAIYVGLATVEGQLITPYFVGRSLRLNTVVVFIAVSFWAWLWSAVGMLVAVPLLVAINTFCEHIDGLSGLGKFLSERYSEQEIEEGAGP
ncbi:MAG: AI-2E family transporter [Rhizobium sp.]|jgi:predicted PurR-regulated permease PerM|uniref:AI-2E family transporter n=1 Tax=Rhizobium sp. TaxID=391 RepID=UPI0009DCDB5C